MNDSNVDLEKFPASKVKQLAKKMESSKATACHIKQVAGDPQAVQINFMRHKHTDISSGKHKKENLLSKQNNQVTRNCTGESQASSYNKKSTDPRNAHKNKDRCPKCGDSTYVEGFQSPAKKFQCKACHKFGHFTSLCYQKRQAPFKSRRPKAHQLQAGTVYVQERAICSHSEDYSSSDDSFCLQIKVQCTQASLKKIPTPTHLITNLAYRLKPHHTRNQYFRVRLDTCMDVNIMPTSAYSLVFKDPELQKLFPAIWRLELIQQTQSRL